MPKITVLLPIFNAENYIESCLSSLIAQTFKDFEIIAINDGSTDRTLKILERFAIKEKRLKIINQENNGLIKTLNRGLELASGKYLARIDSDDIAHQERLEIQANYLDEHNRCLMCGTDFFTFRDENPKLKRFSTRQNPNFHKAEMIFGPSIAHSSVMFRAEDFARLCLKYDPKYRDAEDYELWTRVQIHGEIKVIPKPLMKIRLHSGSITDIADSRAKHSERISIISEIQNNYLNALGVNLTKDDQICHYMLSDRKRFLLTNQKNLKDVSLYASRLVDLLLPKNIWIKDELSHILRIRLMKIIYTVIISKKSDIPNLRHCISLLV